MLSLGPKQVCFTLFIQLHVCSEGALCNHVHWFTTCTCVWYITPRITGDQGHGWSKAYVFIGAQTSYTIDVKTTIGKSPEARIAVDDFGFLHCHDSGTSCSRWTQILSNII